MGCFLSGGANQATVLATCSIRGQLGPDGSHKAFPGGFSRRATLIAAERSRGNPVLLVDAGNFLVPNRSRETDPDAKNALIWDLMGRLNYDVVTPGDVELLCGRKAIQDLTSRTRNVRVVSANILDTDGNRIWPASDVIERDGVRFGITGVTDPRFYEFNVRRGVQEADDVTFLDPEAALSTVLPGLRKDADIVVLLLHMGPDDAYRLVRAMGDVDVAVVGHNPGRMDGALRVGRALALRTGQYGDAVGIVNLERRGREFAAVQGSRTTVEHALTPDPGIEQLVLSYETQERKDREARRNRLQD